MAELILGPLLRYVSETEATVWVETDGSCEVEVLGATEETFEVQEHHYALVCIEGLEPGETYEYEVKIDGERCWPLRDWDFPSSVVEAGAPDQARPDRRVGPDPPPLSRLKSFAFERLIERAETQRTELEQRRLQAAREAFGESSVVRAWQANSSAAG